MTEQNKPASGVAMIRIDGVRVKQLREEQGLTQLYLATAVGVTTDTISRWENRHYPTIKQENGLRLAQTLDVSLDEILEKTDAEEVMSTSTPAQVTDDSETRLGVPLKTYNRVVNIGLAVMIPVVIGLIVWNKKQVADFDLNATRVLPLSCAPGLQFPVAIAVHVQGENVPLLIRETVPGQVKIVKTLPDTAAQSGQTLKWIRKEGQRQMSGFLAVAEGNLGDTISFSGKVAVRQGKKQEVVTGGTLTMTLAPVHWADIDGDHVISDDEVLEAYDKFGKLPGLDRELDQVEEIWMGTGYRWEAESKTITILP